MPVARLSRNFYEKLGDDITDELVNCLNTIESSYRLELRDLFDAHFGRFEAGLEARFERRFASLDFKIEQMRADLRVELYREIISATRWNFAVWIPIGLAVIGLYFKP